MASVITTQEAAVRMDVMSVLAPYLLAQRLRLNMTQVEVGAAGGFSGVTLCNWENQHSAPRLEHLVRWVGAVRGHVQIQIVNGLVNVTVGPQMHLEDS